MMRRGSISIISLLLVLVSVGWPARAAWNNDKAPEFTLKDLGGQSVSLPALRGKVAVIDFWASWCPPCKEEFPELNRMAGRYRGADLVVLAINIDKTRANAEEFLDRLNVEMSENMRVLLDPRSSVVSSYGTRAMPTSFIVDQSGVIRFVHLGYNETDPEKWVSEIESLLQQEG